MLARAKRKSCGAFLDLVSQGKLAATVTDFTIYSTMIILETARRLNQLKIFLSSLSGYEGLTLYPLSLEEKIAAAELAIDGKLDLDDALQYAAARKLKVEGIVSLDKHFEGLEIRRMDPAGIASIE